MSLALGRNRDEWQPRCDECGRYGEWHDASQSDLCEECEAEWLRMNAPELEEEDA